MNEQDWLAANVLEPMLSFVRTRASKRQLRLFTAALCRRIWSRLGDRRSRNAVLILERYADGTASSDELLKAAVAAAEAAAGSGPMIIDHLKRCSSHRASVLPDTKLLELTDLAGAAVYAALAYGPYTGARYAASRAAAAAGPEETLAQCRLLRDVVGNPFLSPPPRRFFPGTVLELAKSLYEGENYTLPLHDALLDSGYVDVANHFLVNEHPRGCRVLDDILGLRS